MLALIILALVNRLLMNKEPTLFDVGRTVDEEWEDMPEYIQDNMEGVKSITVRFESIEDMNKFSELIGINITMQTKGVYWPKKESKKLIYIDEGKYK